MNFISNKKLDVHKRMMDVRKESYTKINEIFSVLYDTAKDEDTKEARADILKLYREIQLWGSDDVIRKLQELLFAIDVKNKTSQEKRNLAYKSFVIAMREDMLGETKVSPEEIQIHGLIN